MKFYSTSAMVFDQVVQVVGCFVGL
jgi:hypothetical protein